MSWGCPRCKRLFKRKNQWHSCVQMDAGKHFIGRQPNVKKVFDKILSETKKFGPVNVSTVKNAIMLKSSGTFLAVKPKKEWLDMEFLLDEEINEFPVHKTFRISKNRVAHFMRLEKPAEVDKQLVNWIKRAYHLLK
jgi:hypothetical protein